MKKGRTPPPEELPTIQVGQPDAYMAPLSPLSTSQPTFRRHTRKRSSTIYLPPRTAVQPNPQAEAAPMVSGLLRGVTTLAGAQLLAKLLAFVLNQLLLRFVGARDLGAAAQLDLLVATTLALSRDAVRLSSQRQTPARLNHVSEYTTDGRAVLDTLLGALQQTVNLGWTAWAIGSVLIVTTSGWLVTRSMWPSDAAFVYVLAAVLELAAEPCFLLAQLQLKLGLRAKAESLATAARVCMVAVMLVGAKVAPILGFAFGQLAYASTLAAVYYLAAIAEKRRAGFSLLPARVWTTQDQNETVLVGQEVYKTSLELGVQQIVKFFLSEGDKFAVGLMTTLEQQGEYALASNYGSLLARMLLFPIEEALRSYFSRALPKPRVDDSLGLSRAGSVRRTSPTAESVSPLVSPVSPASPEDAELPTEIPSGPITTLASVLRAYTYLGLLAAGFGPLVAKYMLSWVINATRFRDAPAVLAAYAIYIPILAWNGVLEAVVQSVGSLGQLRQQGYALTAVAFAFVVFVYIFVSVLQLGAVGLVYAQILAMSIRTVWSLHFATTYFGKGYGWLQECLPKWWVLALASAIIGVARFEGPAATFGHFALDVVLAVLVAAAAAMAEREQLAAIYSKTGHRSKGQMRQRHQHEHLKQE